jgi:hypothetical protein
MAYELLTVLLGGCAGAAMMLYLASRPYGQAKNATSPVTSLTTYVPTTEQAEAPEAPVVVAPAPSPAPEPAPAPAMYETVQPAPAPVTYTAPSTPSFGAPTLTRKPTRTYRRRTAPVRSAPAKKTLAPKHKKR